MGRSENAENVTVMLKSLKLPTMAATHRELARQAEQQGWSFEQYLRELADQELAERGNKRVERLLKESKLPADKSFASFDQARLPAQLRRTLASLRDGKFLDRAENLLAFGLPGRGKTHMLCALAHDLVSRGRRILFISTFKLVERLLAAKKELALDRELKRLDRYEAVLIDDLGYVQQSREEMEVLFTFLSERYERRSVMITSNLVFSQWERIFKDPMTTAAAIDRLIHHATILELTGQSVREDQAQSKQGKGKEKVGKQETAATIAGNERDREKGPIEKRENLEE